MDDEDIENEIKYIFPSLENSTVKALMERLVDLGVSKYSDLSVIEEADIKDILKVVQARLLIRRWKSRDCESVENVYSPYIFNEQPSTSQAHPSTSQAHPSTSQAHPSTSQAHSSTPQDVQVGQSQSPKQHISNLEWAYNYAVPWNRMPTELIKNLEENIRPKPNLRRSMVRIITDDISRISTKPGRKALSIIARNIVNKYSLSFADIICNEIIGGGYSSLLKQIEVRFDNLNRVSPYNILKRSMQGNSSESKKKLSVSDAYGCMNWQPSHLPVHETAETQEYKKNIMIEMLSSNKNIDVQVMKIFLEETYYTQRKHINMKRDIMSLKKEWPFLFKKEGLLHHFKMLMEFDCSKRFFDALDTKAARIFNFLQSFLPKKKQKRMQEVLNEFQMNVEDPNLQMVLILLSIYFEEDIKDLLIAVDVTFTTYEVESMELPSTPCVICYGVDIMNASQYAVVIDEKLVIANVKEFNEGFLLMFISYYCFNIHYPKSATITLEFVQRCFLGINPSRGSKRNPEGKQKEYINTKILTMLNKLSQYELIEAS